MQQHTSRRSVEIHARAQPRKYAHTGCADEEPLLSLRLMQRLSRATASPPHPCLNLLSYLSSSASTSETPGCLCVGHISPHTNACTLLVQGP
eukprot:1288959-Pleurochrysis_carterae.AAC.1